jgi:hypothetical protein
MNFLREDKICNGTRLLCKKSYNSYFIVGQYYEIDIVISHLCYQKYDINIDGWWFSIMFDDSSSIFPYAIAYFYSEQEERKIKLQIISLISKINE